MKKILLFVTAACLLLTMASCGAGDLGASSAPTASDVSSVPVDKVYSEDMKGLIEKLTDNGYLVGAGSPMKAEYVGAFEGYRFVNGGLTVELYQFDPNGLTDISKRCISEVKEKGTVTVLETYAPAPADLSSNEKYLMIYRDSATGEEADARKEKAVEIVRDFK